MRGLKPLLAACPKIIFGSLFFCISFAGLPKIYAQAGALNGDFRGLHSEGKIGDGGVGDVYKVITPESNIVAAKIFRKTNRIDPSLLVDSYRLIKKKMDEETEKDIPFLKILKVGNFKKKSAKGDLVKVRGAVIEYSKNIDLEKAFPILNLIDNNNKKEIEDRIQAVRIILDQFLDILFFLSKWGVVLNDITPSNILFFSEDNFEVSTETIKLGKAKIKAFDYDFASFYFSPINGYSPDHSAPELVNFGKRDVSTIFSDLYSVGSTMYALIFNINPWSDFEAYSKDFPPYVIDIDSHQAFLKFVITKFKELEEDLKLQGERLKEFRDIKNFIIGSLQKTPNKRANYLEKNLSHIVTIYSSRYKIVPNHRLEAYLLGEQQECDALFLKDNSQKQ